MRTLTTPDSISGAFASGVNAVKNEIPNLSTGTYLASMEDGFPVITMQPTSLGGTPPDGKDFNGILNKVTQFYFQFQNGYLPTFVQATSDLIGGYPEGAVLWYTPSGENKAIPLISLIENNTYNFNTTPAYIDGTHWEYAITGDYVTINTTQTISGDKTFSGNTKAVTPATTDNSTKIATTEFVVDVLKKIYPVGSMFIGTGASCPLSSLFGTWDLVASNVVISVNSTAQVKGTGKSLGLTDGTHNFGLIRASGGNAIKTPTNAYNVNVGSTASDNQECVGVMGVTTDSSKSGLTATVTSSSLTANIWKRSA